VAGRRKALLESASLIALCSSRHLPCLCDVHLDLSRAPAPQIGSRYTLVRVLGYGSFSAVCLAVDQETGEKVGGRQGGAQSSLQPGQTQVFKWLGGVLMNLDLPQHAASSIWQTTCGLNHSSNIHSFK
jgi:serine/threonine protein kinase